MVWAHRELGSGRNQAPMPAWFPAVAEPWMKGCKLLGVLLVNAFIP